MLQKIGTLLLLFAAVLTGISCSQDDKKTDNPVIFNPVIAPYTGSDNWLIMVYADADNDLEEYILSDINEMEGVDLSGKNTKIIALVDRGTGDSSGDSDWTGDGNWTDTRAFEISFDGGYNSSLKSKRIAMPSLGISTTSTSVECNMGDGATLQKFVSDTLSAYPSYTNTMLILTNHGGGWRDTDNKRLTRLKKMGPVKDICWDETDGGDCLYTKEMTTAIDAALPAGEKLDIIAFDACLMATVEVAYELRTVAEYMVASEETIPGYGFPYTQILRSIAEGAADSGDTRAEAVKMGAMIADNYYNAYTIGECIEEPGIKMPDITLSVVNLDETSWEAIASDISALGNALVSGYGTPQSIDAYCLVSKYADPTLIDLKDFCNIETVASTQRSSVDTALSGVIAHNRCAGIHSFSQGLSIYFTPDASDVSFLYDATQISFPGAAPGWLNLLNALTDTSCSDLPELTGNNEALSWFWPALIGFAAPDATNPLFDVTDRTKTGNLIFHTRDKDAFIICDFDNLNTLPSGSISFASPAGKVFRCRIFELDLDTGEEALLSTINGSGTYTIPTYMGAITIIVDTTSDIDAANPYTLSVDF